MKKSDAQTVLTLLLAVVVLLAGQVMVHAATITDGYPGDPNQWEGLTTNTIIEISLDEAVAMTGNQPDMTYCVKKASFSGLDFVLTDVSCEVEVSADRKTIKLYPADLLDGNSLYAYKVVNINFEGGGSAQDAAAYFETGDNPVPLLATQVNEADMCDDEGGNMDPHHASFHCVRCHVEFAIRFPSYYGTCIITPGVF